VGAIPNRSSITKAYEQFDGAGETLVVIRSAWWAVMEELMKFALLTRRCVSGYPTSRNSERKQEAEKRDAQMLPRPTSGGGVKASRSR
jgi:arsenic resistance protein ArsH